MNLSVLRLGEIERGVGRGRRNRGVGSARVEGARARRKERRDADSLDPKHLQRVPYVPLVLLRPSLPVAIDLELFLALLLESKDASKSLFPLDLLAGVVVGLLLLG